MWPSDSTDILGIQTHESIALERSKQQDKIQVVFPDLAVNPSGG